MMKTQSENNQSKGFALISTISIMALLMLIAVSMLSLSTIEVRASQSGKAMAEARANARMALMIAIGELQRSMGPDRRISATSEILATASTTVAKPNTTGVWKSWWDFDPNASPNYSDEKTSRFQRWLVSSADVADPQSLDFVTSAWTGRTIELVGTGSLGGSATAADKVTAGLVEVSKNGQVKGAYGWHVSDESVKARINLYRDPSQNTTLAQKRALLAGHRPDPSVMRGPDGNLLTSLPTDLDQAEFDIASASIGKIIDLEQAELLDLTKEEIKPFRNDITTYSLGVLADVRGGGLKQDLSSMFEMGSATTNTLPTEFTDEKLYESTLGIEYSGVSDPNWSALAGYYNSFRNLTSPESNPTFAVKSASTFTNPVPAGYNPAPVIVKVDTIFSLVARPLDKMAHWISNSDGVNVKAWDYLLNLIYTPVVVLHNPYNVNISFNRMDVTFKNVPVGFNFMFKPGEGGPFVSRSVVEGDFDFMNSMVNVGSRGRGDKSFTMSIANWSDAESLPANNSIASLIVLKPGQTMIFGPVFPPNSSYDKDTKSGTRAVGFDWEWGTGRTKKIKSRPGLIPGIGFETNSITIASRRSARNAGLPQITVKSNGQERKLTAGAWGTQSALPLRDANDPNGSPSTVTDSFYVEYKVQRPEYYLTDTTNTATPIGPEFTVTAQIQPAAGGALVDFAKLEFSYQDDDVLQETFEDRVFRYPPTGSLTGSGVLEDGIPAAPSEVPYSAQGAYVHPFAIFSAYTRATNGGVYETAKRAKSGGNSPELNLLKDGRLAGKPFLFHNPSRSNFTMNLANEKPGIQAYELNFQPFLSKGDYQDYMDVDSSNRVPSLSGNKTGTGIKSGSYLELPSGPLQTIADFRRSNALTTTYLPHFVQPVGNSLLHPLMSADKVIETNSSITATALLDHSVLANHALYDRFYFSTFATRGTTTPDTVFEQFMNGSAPLASQSFQPYWPGGKTLATAKADLFSAGIPKDSAYQTAAEYQMIRGPFNVNSTSVQAWKAVLASMNKSDVTTLWARTAGLETKKAVGVPITAMSLVNGGVNGPLAAVDPSKIDNERSNDWNGYRELTEVELENLAIKIVAEVRERGPFLSMSEFVNRQVGPLGPLTLSGALEAAIAKAEINETQDAVSPETFLDQTPITAADISDPKLYAYKTPEATTGNPAAGAPGWVNQGDLLRILEPSATVRGDTFVIRVYGEAQDTKGNITARAYAEAVVQRVPEYVDPVDRPSLNASTDDSTATEVNKTFGRRMNVVSFRWLSDKEI